MVTFAVNDEYDSNGHGNPVHATPQGRRFLARIGGGR